jgi:hypothetical protein
MEEKCLNRMIDKYCKIVIKEPGEESVHVIFGMVINIDHDSGLIVIESKQGLGCIDIKTVGAIKPSAKNT